MTLIATIDDGGDAFFAVSDIFITDDSFAAGDKDLLPLQFGIVPQMSATIGRAIRSKSVIFDNYLLMWTGNVFGADRLIEAVTKDPPATTQEFFALATCVQDWVIDHLADKIVLPTDAHFSAILCWHDGSEYWVAQFNSPSQQMDNINLCVGGTGKDDFVIEFNRQLASNPVNIPTAVAGSVGGLINNELTQRAHQFEAYGGGYELIRFREGGGFCKIPYSICEISHIDHVSRKRLSYWHVSRIIQYQPHSDGCFFVTAVIPHKGSDHPWKAKLFWVDCYHTRPTSNPAIPPFIQPEFGMAITIDTMSFVTCSQKPFAKLLIGEGKIEVEYDLEATQKCTERYVDSWLQATPGSAIGAQIISCRECKKQSEELNYIAIFNEYQVQISEKHLCNNCLTKDRENSP